MSEKVSRRTQISRRSFIRSCSVAASLVSSAIVLDSWGMEGQPSTRQGAAQHTISLDRDWLFGGKLTAAATEAGFNDSSFSRITLPHCVTPLSWQKWDPGAWQNIFIYRRHFQMPPELAGLRFFLRFDRVMAGATPVVNGHALPQHLGGFLPFEREITSLVKEKDNVLSVSVDSRWLNVPPAGSPRGPISIDYMLPGGISGSVSLRAVPHVFISDVFAKPVNVLSPDRKLEITCCVDAGAAISDPLRLTANLMDGSRSLGRAVKNVTLEKTGGNQVQLTLGDLENITLWDVDKPHLYDLIVTLSQGNNRLHNYKVRVGFREASFELNGFFLNGRRLQLFGLNRHELYPYVGFAMPPRVLRKDAEILRHTFNCNFVRCSHYPQSEAFLNACDELGLMVWEELPGWQYIGDESWQKLALLDVEGMVRRDRNHPSVVIWGVRINESANDPELYRRTREMAKSLDSSRPTSGTMTHFSTRYWHQDVFAFDDYHASPKGTVSIEEPMPGVPYMISEAVGQFNYETGRGFNSIYRRAADPWLQSQQSLRHAQAHSKGAANPRCAGVVAWCAFDYGSLMNSYEGVKYPGVADVFRIPKLGASFYMAQLDPTIRAVIEPDFYWDFGAHTPNGPCEKTAIFSNCDLLRLFINNRLQAVLIPDFAGYPNLKHPPFFANLKMNGSDKPVLRIDGYLGDKLALSRSFSADHSADRLWLHVDDADLQADGSDATRLAFGAVDKFGSLRPFAEGEVSFHITGPGVIVGNNPFQLTDSGGAAAVWVKSVANAYGLIKMEARHPTLGGGSVEIHVRKPYRTLSL